ncbi:hypothetical protein [Candidatus Electronema sp. TJ]
MKQRLQAAGKIIHQQERAQPAPIKAGRGVFGGDAQAEELTKAE